MFLSVPDTLIGTYFEFWSLLKCRIEFVCLLFNMSKSWCRFWHSGFEQKRGQSGCRRRSRSIYFSPHSYLSTLLLSTLQRKIIHVSSLQRTNLHVCVLHIMAHSSMFFSNNVWMQRWCREISNFKFVFFAAGWSGNFARHYAQNMIMCETQMNRVALCRQARPLEGETNVFAACQLELSLRIEN